MLMNISDFDYNLPTHLIAQSTSKKRDDCRLMFLSKNSIEHKKFYNVLDIMKKGDVIVMNSTKVLHNKLVGKKETGSCAEIILTKRLGEKRSFNDISDEKDSDLLWECHIKTKNPHIGTKILFKEGQAIITDQISVDRFIIRLSDKKILKYGLLPNPPYIKHDLKDDEYQTVYARDGKRGSVAAPTAGLHFTKDLIKDIKNKGIKIVYINLHVGFGTFLPIMCDIDSHKTEQEFFEISANSAKIINERKGKLIVVGTTTLKALESSSIDGKIIPARKYSDIFIYPGHRFSCDANLLITNFHLPKSSLILLTCAFGKTKRVMDAYKAAVEENYRFYSLGDAMMIYRANI